VTKNKYVTNVYLVTPKAGAKHERLFTNTASGMLEKSSCLAMVPVELFVRIKNCIAVAAASVLPFIKLGVTLWLFWAQCHKTLFVCNLQMFVISQLF
jgi:hypothetical protein